MPKAGREPAQGYPYRILSFILHLLHTVHQHATHEILTLSFNQCAPLVLVVFDGLGTERAQFRLHMTDFTERTHPISTKGPT